MQDHYSFFDPGISAFNFLKFSEPTWSLINSSVHYQNRLRASDFRRLHEDAGFRLLRLGGTDTKEGRERRWFQFPA